MSQEAPSQEKIPGRSNENVLPELFRAFSEHTAKLVGTWQAFVLSIAIVVVWAITGPLFNFSDTWQLVINTSTTVITFWLVFVIQYTQNRDNRALHMKIDELVSAVPEASDEIMSIEHLSDRELDKLQDKIMQHKRAKS